MVRSFIRYTSDTDRTIFSYLVKFFPPVVTGSVVTIIGINLMPVAMNYLAGGEGAKIMEILKFNFRCRYARRDFNYSTFYNRFL